MKSDLEYGSFQNLFESHNYNNFYFFLVVDCKLSTRLGVFLIGVQLLTCLASSSATTMFQFSSQLDKDLAS
jgi:hypothetical protein